MTEECNFSEETKRTLNRVDFIAQRIEKSLETIKDLMKETTNTQILTTLDKTNEKMDAMNSHISKLNALVKMIDTIYTDIAHYQSYLKDISASNNFLIEKYDCIEVKILELHSYLVEEPKKEKNEMILNRKPFWDFLSNNIKTIVFLICFIILAALATCDRFDMNQAVKSTSNNLIKRVK